MTLESTQLERILGRIDTYSENDLKRLLSGLAQEVNDQSARDGLFWLRFVKTRDEADGEETVKPFPLHLGYVKELWAILDRDSKIVIAKSRQMLVSWILAAFAVHRARYRPHQAIYWQTKKEEDAIAMVCMPEGGVMGRCQFIEANLPPWMKVKYKPSEGRLQYPNGSIIQSLAGGADKIRGKTASLIIEDEMAYQDDQPGVYTAVMPLVQKGAKIVFVSTPNGSANMFATVYHGRPVGENAP